MEFTSSLKPTPTTSIPLIRFPNPNRLNRIPTRIRLRRFSYSSSCSLSASSAASYENESVSLGHLTRSDFPILHQEVNKKKLVYLDNAATSQKPSVVLTALKNYYESYNENVHRGVHKLSKLATDDYELARKKVASFINAGDPCEIVFTKNATEAINLVAYSWGLSNLRPGDEI
ncbi:hypothetical protein Droror1_Dr00008510 [Drosera rotundifolia]